MKNSIKRAAALALFAVMSIMVLPWAAAVTGITAFAAETDEWKLTWNPNKCSIVSVSETVFHGDSGYSIMLTNEDYNVSVAEKIYQVIENTKYRFTAWVKYADCKVSPNSTGTSAGARLGKAVVGYGDGCYNGNEWQQLVYEFDSGDSNTYRIGLYNGLDNSECKGTAYFSDFSLEPVYPWDSTYQYHKNQETKFSVDKQNVYGDFEYSIKITNTDYNVSYVTKTFEVNKNTTYKVSAWVKCSGYKLIDGRNVDSGACISIPGNTINNKYMEASKIANRYTGTKWNKLEFEFDSGNNTTYDVAFYNGMWYADSKGTVFFCDIQLTPVYPWDSTLQWYKDREAQFSVDYNNVYGEAEYSIKITNSDYNLSNVQKTFEVKKNTHYRASVMAKCSGYELYPDHHYDSGAAIGNPENNTGAEQYTGTAWKRIYYEFDSEDSTEYTIALYNGLRARDCKGTVWFSDFRLEERTGKPSNRWNVLAVVFKNVEAPVDIGGKKLIHKGILNSADVEYLESVINNMYTSVPVLSEGLWGFNSFDLVSTDAVVDGLRFRKEDSYCIDCNLDCVSKELDKFIDKAAKESGKQYDQIIVLSNLKGVTKDWFGLGGSTYKGINFCQVSYGTGDDWEKMFRTCFNEGVFVHEILHCVERISRDELKSPTQKLHANEEIYGEIYQDIQWNNLWDGNGTYYSDYMRCKTPDGLGVDKKAFESYRNSTYKVIYGSEPAYPKTDVSKLTISKPKESFVYTGKAIKPELTVKDGKKTLVNGKDYTLTYINNTDVGNAAVIVNGKGNYSGKYAQNFIIKPKKTTLTVTKNNGRYTFSWKEGTGANKYQIYYSTDGGKKYKLLKTIDGEMNSTTIKLDTSKNYRFRIRSVKELYPKKIYSSYSAVVTAKTATAQNSNEAFKFGKLYVVQSKDSGKAMDIANSSKNNGGDLIQFTYSGKKSQKWYLEQQSTGYYLIKNYNSGKVITVDDSNNAVQQKYTGDESQQWLIKKVGKYYKIINRESGKSLDVYGYNKRDGASIVQWQYGGKDNQLWSISLA